MSYKHGGMHCYAELKNKDFNLTISELQKCNDAAHHISILRARTSHTVMTLCPTLKKYIACSAVYRKLLALDLMQGRQLTLRLHDWEREVVHRTCLNTYLNKANTTS